MRAMFSMIAADADKLLRPALADWRDAVGCADPLLLAANAAEEPQLVPLPLPSWCASLAEAGILELMHAPRVEGPRITLKAALAVVREAELEGVERFPVTFAGRFAPSGPHVHLAISPPFRSQAWRGPVCLRAAAEARLWLGTPSSPAAPARGESGQTVVTLADPDEWIVLRQLAGREPQALWRLSELWKARLGDAPEAETAAAAGAPVSMRLGIDLGSTSTVVVEEDEAASGAPGAKLSATAASGFRRLAGDPTTAHRYGCGERLLAPAGHLPTALAAGSSDALLTAIETGDPLQLWLPQEGEGDPPLLADRFKSPELLLLSEWFYPQLDPKPSSRKLLELYGRLLGQSLAAAHATPLVVAEGARWALRAPRLETVEAVLTYPRTEPFEQVFDGVGRAVRQGLAEAWPKTSHALVPDPLAARIAAGASELPIEAFVDFGGLTLQIAVRVPGAPGRPAPFIAGSSMTYLLGGERVLDAAAFASADLDDTAPLRDAFRSRARSFRSLISRGGRSEAPEAPALKAAVLEVVAALVKRQIEATLRRASLDHGALRGAGVRLFLLGEGWKLAALDVPDSGREAATVQRLEEVLGGVERIDKRRLCEGALRASRSAAQPEPPVELHCVDVGAGDALVQRWFATAGERRAGLHPLQADPWWRAFSAGEPSLLRVEQWFGAGESPFDHGLAGGPIGFDGARSALRQWVDVGGASLVALRIHRALSTA